MCLAAIVVATAGLPVPARADETTVFANVIAAESALDIAQTESGLHTMRCHNFMDPADPLEIAYRSCAPQITEADPLARPFVHSPLTALAAGTAINVGLRAIGEHVRPARLALAGVALLYPLLLVHNAHELHVAVTFRP